MYTYMIKNLEIHFNSKNIFHEILPNPNKSLQWIEFPAIHQFMDNKAMYQTKF